MIRLTFHSKDGWYSYGFEKQQAEKFLLKIRKKAKSRTYFSESKISFETVFGSADLSASKETFQSIFDCLSNELDYINGVKDRPVAERLYVLEYEDDEQQTQLTKEVEKEVAPKSEKSSKTPRKSRKQPAKEVAKKVAKKPPSKKKGATKSKMVRKRRS